MFLSMKYGSFVKGHSATFCRLFVTSKTNSMRASLFSDFSIRALAYVTGDIVKHNLLKNC